MVFRRYFLFHLTFGKLLTLQNIALTVCPKICCKKFENRLSIKKFCPKPIMNRDFSVQKNQGREVSIFQQNFETRSTLSKSFKIFIKCHKILT